MKGILIAGTTSGVGKTTVSAGIMGILTRRGYRVQPFKTGPDYIDPSYHTSITGEISRNLDTWMLSRNAILELFSRAMKGKDIAVIEGVMGLYDGQSPITDEGSTAELAKLLGVPVLLVLDCQKGARSLAAMVTGYKNFDPELNIAGVILNGIGSEAHLKICDEAIRYYTGIPVVGYLTVQKKLELPERHLGLIPASESPLNHEFIDNLISQCEATFQIDEILRLSESAKHIEIEPELFPQSKKTTITRIGIARDKAFSFYYQDSLDLLEAWGAELAFFSPIADSSLPDGISGLYLGGGFPELYSAELAENNSMKNSIKTASKQGMPIYAECGGLMYLGKTISDFNAREYSMVGAIDISSRIDKHRLSLGYRIVQALTDGILLGQGETARGHEFHYSVLSNECDANAYKIVDSDRIEGFHKVNTVASYIHIHLASRISMVHRFIACCQKYKKDRV